MGNLFTRLSSFLFILIGRQPNSEKKRSGFELARLAAQRIRAGSACSAADSEWAWLFIILIMRQPNSKKQLSGFELARLAAQRNNTCPAHLILFFILSFDV